MKKAFGKYIVLFVALFSSTLLYADIKLPNILTSNMVLQQGKPVAIWGMADVGERVTVQFAGQEASTIADADGKWKIFLKKMKVFSTPRSMIVKGKNTITLDNILVGEVWLCGGQSNMEYPMDITLKKYAAPERGENLAAKELEGYFNNLIRVVLIEKKRSLPDCTTKGWQESSCESLAGISAVGYFFAKEIQVALKEGTPVGIITSAWGGSRIEPWTPREAYENSPLFADRMENGIDGYKNPGNNYYSMIKPLAPYTMRGFLWYQGESNAMFHDGLYVEKMELLINAWRTVFEDEELPFYFVQLAPYAYTRRKDKLPHPPSMLAEFRELQKRCLAISNTGMVVTTDLADNVRDIHPSYKWEVGRRLALVALSKTYKQKGMYTGPLYKSMKIEANKIILDFNYKGKGLMAASRYESQDNSLQQVKDGKLTWFTIAGSDGKFYNADAFIANNKVIVSSPQVQNPESVRFAWDESAMPNLYNREGLPAIPFRTDRLPLMLDSVAIESQVKK